MQLDFSKKIKISETHKKYKWIRQDYDIRKEEHVYSGSGEFTAKNLRGAKTKASRESGVKKGVWIKTHQLPFFTVQIGYIKQEKSRPEYKNMHPKVYVFEIL